MGEACGTGECLRAAALAHCAGRISLRFNGPNHRCITLCSFSYCETLHPRVWPHCADDFAHALTQVGCIDHSLADVSPLLKLPVNASVLEIPNA